MKIRWMLAALCAATPAGAAPPKGEAFTPEHVARLQSVREVALAPDGRFAAYVLAVPRPPYDDEDGPAWQALHVVDGVGHARPFVTGKVSVSGLDWTPDGRGVSFVATRADDEKPALYVIPVDGGEAQRRVTHAEGVGGYAWSPDGKRVAFLARAAEEEQQKKLSKKGFRAEIYEEDGRPTKVWIATLDAGDSKKAEPRALELPGSASVVRWSPKGDRLAVVLAPTPLVDDELMSRVIHLVDVEKGKVVGTVDAPGKLGDLRWSPDGARLAFVGAADQNDPAPGRLMVVGANGGKPTELLPDYAGHVEGLAWQGPDRLLYLGYEGTRTVLGRIGVDGTGRETVLPAGEVIASQMSVSASGARVALLGDTARHPREVFLLDGARPELRRLTDSNPWLGDLRFAAQETVEYTARDGLTLQGVLLRPLDAKKGARVPLIVVPHGGPESHVPDGWLTGYGWPGQVSAARGFAVFHPNYRGSTGRGVEFSKLGQGDYAGGEFNDLVDAVDHLVATGLVDGKRVGVTGFSYGGFATAWCATKLTERFAAGVMVVGISDHISKAGTTDIPQEMYRVHSRKWPWEHWDWFRERSPIFHAKGARTPLLIIHGREDTRVHPSQSLELYRYLKLAGSAPVRLVLYPGEGHGMRNAAARYDFQRRQLRWLEHYLKGKGGAPPPYALPHDAKKLGEQAAGAARHRPRPDPRTARRP